MSAKALHCKSGDSLRSAVTVENVVMYMPANVHQITPSQGGKAVSVTVNVNAKSATAIQRQFDAMVAKGAKPYFSIGEDSHKSDIASFWPSRFFWDTRLDATGKMATGVWCEGEWTATGREAVEGKDFRCFSPTFFVDSVRNDARNPAQVVTETDAGPNMGALVNDPAFKSISPLWCRNAGGVPTGNKQQKPKHMTETKAELQARKEILDGEIKSLVNKTDELSAAKLQAKRMEVEAIDAKILNEEMQAQNTETQAALLARREQDADAEVARQEAAGLIGPRETERKTALRAAFVQNPSLIALQAKGGKPASGATARVPGANASEIRAVATEGLEVYAGCMDVLKGIALNCANQNKVEGMSLAACKSRSELAAKTALIYEKEIRSKRFDSDGLPMVNTDYLTAPLMAATEGDTLGTLVGTLVSQRMLDLFRYSFPLLKLVMTDMSDEPSDLNQAVKTRKVLIPSVQSFDDTLDTDNRPKGWSTASIGSTTDISITLDELVGVPISFSMATLSSTQRKLFTEQAPAAVYALTKYWMAKVYGVCTAANFADYAAVTAAGADGIVKVPTAYPTYAKAAIDFGRKSIGEIGAAFDANEVPDEGRTMLLNAAYYDAATNDPTLVNFFAGQQSPEIITEGRLPRLKNFNLVKAANFPSSGNRVGIALQKNGLLIKSRLPSNYQDLLPGSGNGSITQISDAQTGLSIMLIQYVNNTRGFAEWLPCVIIGAAKGDTRGGMVVTSA